MQNLIIIRGLPGSGKSTLGGNVVDSFPGFTLCEADDFFVKDGVYTWNRAFIGAAHDECYSKAMKTLMLGGHAVVCNTFCTVREIQRYVQGAKRAGFTEDNLGITVYKCVEDYGSVHGVPGNAIQHMKTRWEDYRGEKTYLA